MRTALIGHRKIFDKNISERLKDSLQNQIEKGCKTFIMGMHGDFDALALSVCRSLRQEYKELEIEVAITSLHVIEKFRGYNPNADVKTVMYNIESAHYKQKITLSNRKMIDSCDTLICYVDESRYKSGAKTAMHYAEKKGKQVINLYRLI